MFQKDLNLVYIIKVYISEAVSYENESFIQSFHTLYKSYHPLNCLFKRKTHLNNKDNTQNNLHDIVND